MKKIFGVVNKTFLAVFIYTIFIMIWYLVFWGAKEFFVQGMYTVFEDLYGIWSIWLGCIITIVVFISPLYLRKWIKTESIISLVAVFMSIVFVGVAFWAYQITYEQFRDFTSERWHKYNRQRLIMLEDLRTNHITRGMTKSEVIKTLGNPDRLEEKGVFEYSYGYGYIRILFDGEAVRDVEGMDMFGKYY